MKSRLLSFIMTMMAILMPAKLLAQCPDSNHPHMIDLGLPSETKWSCCNMDAETPESYGGYYSWGETEVKDSYEYETYKFFTSWSDSPWYQNIGRVITRTEYDVAYTKWGDAWQMPTEGQIQELIDNTTAVWTTQNGVVGTLFTGINGNSIFLPASATRWGTNTPELGTTGFYWSSELRNTDQTTPYILQINSEGVQLLENKERCSGVLVRPVTPQIHSTYTGAEGGIVERVNNGNLESDEYYNFAYTGESTTTELQATDIVADPDDATNHCIKLVKGHDWDYPDFHIKVSANSVSLYPGQKYTFSMRVKASQTTQIHSSGLGSWGQLRIDGMIGSFDVTTEWTTINYEGVVTDAQAGVGQLAFVFNDSAPVEYYFDDITFQVETGDTFVSSCEGGTELIFTVVSEDEQTCAIGDFLGRNEDGIHWAMTEIGVAGTLTLPSTVEHNGITYSVKFVGNGALAENTLFDTIIIPDGITYVGPAAFWINHALKSISIPKTVKGLGAQAFSNCYNLEKVYCYIEEPFIIEETMFSTNSNWTTATLYVPAGCKPKYEATEGWNLFQNIVEMADPYAVLSDNNTVLTFYYDDQKTARGGMDVGPFASPGERGWYDDLNITNVVFDDSFANYTDLTSTAYWFYGLKDLTSILGISNLNTANVTDMTWMFRGCSGLLSLDLRSFNTANVTDTEYIFADCSSLAAIQAGNANIPAEQYTQIGNPNLLVYVNEASLAPQGIQNVVIDGVAKEIILRDTIAGNNNWYCPQPFTAQKISYTRNFQQQTQIGVARGWETIALPFNVQTITYEDNRTISPFGDYSSNYHFWLRRLTQNGLQSVQEIHANMAYVISMPNSSEYPTEYNLAGKVTFSAEDAPIPETYPEMVETDDIAMAPAFQRIEVDEHIYALNVGEPRGNHPEGSVFERNYREVRPFEAFTKHFNENGARFMSIADMLDGGVTGIEELKSGKTEGLKSENWYDLNGRRISSPSKGVYIHNGKQVIVK